ncbi:MAG: sodium:proton antiporter [Gammaproteobacteria bacterium]|nr:sodium:proton antiporter [Gammaproteobacteria bacterium]MBT4331286.1 sodium:proton antiporter [Gammaproteobacteria bacterium]MBT5636770.1 sodium:proton antiporter [Gammaproteobacteria bacterium]MBT6080798.1 sodium:proton antiporter [Gammaproteobacteria bacterium]
MLASFLSLSIFIAVFTVIFLNRIERKKAVLGGAGALLLLGGVMGFYTPLMALEAIYFETLLLIFGMSMVSAILAASGIFDQLAQRVVQRSAGGKGQLWILFVLITYLFSLMVNNLSAMVVILPITLKICHRLRLNPLPILVAEIVASNLGGASTMVGDFPNMIISSAGHLHFIDFIQGMMVPSLLLLAGMLLYFQWTERRRVSFDSAAVVLELAPVEVNQAQLRFGLRLLAFALVGFLLAEWLGIRPGTVAMIVGLIGLFAGGLDNKKLEEASGVGDILFFAGLFVMVGALAATDVMSGLVSVMGVFGDSHLAQLLGLMWVAALVTMFLNAGPSTAFFIPLAGHLYMATPDPAVWWALSLGVLAGSSASLTGATAGSVAASQLDRYRLEHPEMEETMGGGQLDFRGYLQWGLPIMGIFLTFSTLYIALIAR